MPIFLATPMIVIVCLIITVSFMIRKEILCVRNNRNS